MKNLPALLFALIAISFFACSEKSNDNPVLIYTAATDTETFAAQSPALFSALKNENRTFIVSADPAQLTDQNLQQYPAVLLPETNLTDLSQNTEIALERYLQAGGKIINTFNLTDDILVSQKRKDLLRGVLQVDYSGQNPADLAPHFTLPYLGTAASAFLENQEENSYAQDYENGSVVFINNSKSNDYDWISELSNPQKIDFTKATTRPIPAENRFVKENIVGNLHEPMEIDLLPDGRLIFIERHGDVTIYNPATELLKPAGTFDVYTNFEDGLIGLAVDPNYTENRWIYFDYSPAGDLSVNRISRFTMVGDKVDFTTEKILLDIPTDRGTCCHAAGAMAFDPQGNLYMTMGDDTNPWIQAGMAPIDFRADQKYGDALRSAGNTNDLRGKILRITPQPDGTYTIPEGNLFAEGNPKTRPEIYIMGVRNPFTISIDEKNNRLYWGDVGPDAGEADSLRGPRAYDELNMATAAGNFGWPLTRGNRQTYRAYDFATQKSGADFDPDKLYNDSPRNTGLRDLPPAQSSLIWYPYAASEEFPFVGTGGKNPMAGPVYYSENYDGAYRFPDFFDGKVIFYEWMRHWIYTVETDSLGNFRRAVPFMQNTEFSRPMDMIFGKDGSLYMLEYGSAWFARNEKAQLSRIKYVRSNRNPIARISVDNTTGAAPLSVNFSAAKSEDLDGEKLTYRWNFPGYPSKRGETATFTYKYPGIYDAELVVKDASGNTDRARVSIQVGNEKPELAVELAGNQQFYWENVPVQYSVKVSDREDGKLNAGIAPERVSYLIDLLPQGEDLALTEVGHQQADALAGLSRGEILMKKSDCASCHAVDKKINGPSYTDIAQRYGNDKKTVARLAQKIIVGGNGVWGETNMSAHPQLSQNQTEAIVKWILALDAETSSVNRIPLAGSFTPETQPLHKDGYKMHGSYVLSASYTDNGNDKIQPITARAKVVLQPPLFPAERADYMSFSPVDRANNWLQNLQSGDYFTFENTDLTDIGGLRIKYRGKNQSGKNDFILTVKTAEKELAKVTLRTDGNTEITKEIPLPEVSGRQDLTFHTEAKTAGALIDYGWIGVERAEVRLLGME